MNVSQISDHIHYIGVNDRTLHLFEALWPLPYGVSYNSYLVTGADKSAIIDGVELAHAPQQIAHIREILGDRNPDYLVINHMEPDHSGAISLLRREFPGITIVGNAQTLAMVKGFHGITDGVMAVRDGDRLPLGDDATLVFHLTPMVHWPETMMTRLEEEAALFAGDAFGCFGALSGAVVDTDMDTDRYFPEMVRYYSNIVGKYGVFVQRALKKLSEVELKTICPTHGPVWRSRLQEVVELYDRLSRYEPLDNGVTVVYGSMYGNTEMAVEEVTRALAAGGVRNIAVHNASVSTLSDILADIFRHRGLIIASPTYSEGVFPPVRAVVDALAVRGMKNRLLGMVGSHTWAQQAIKGMESGIGTCDFEQVATAVNVKHAPDADRLAECRAMGAEMATRLTAAR